MAFSSQGNLSISQRQASDEVNEMFCEQCYKRDKVYKPAAGFCVDCLDYMCVNCLKYHKIYVPNHSIEDKDSMPQDFDFENCPIHTSQIIKFYCEQCQTFPCSECKAKQHNNCANVRHLPRLAHGIEKSLELKELTAGLEHLSKDIEKTEEKMKYNIQKVLSQETKALKEIKKLEENLLDMYKKYQQDIIDNFDKEMEEAIAKLKRERTMLVEQVAAKQRNFEKTLNDNVKNVTASIANTKIKDQKEIQSIKDKSVTMQNDLKALSSDLFHQKNARQRCKLFMTMKKAQGQTEKVKQDLNQLEKNTDIHYYDVKQEIKKIDAASLQNAKTYFTYRDLPSSRQNRAAYHHSDIAVTKLKLSNLCVLHEHTLLVAALDDSLLIVISNVNVCAEPYRRNIRMASPPWDITKVDDHKAAVTFPDEGIVRLMTFSDSMTVSNTDEIKVGIECRGIAYSKSNLVMSYNTDPPKVQVLDMSGNILKCFDKDSNGEFLFSKPWHVTVSPDNTIIYVSDFSRNNVTSFRTDGNVMAIYRDGQLSGPRQLAVDEFGTVYVCGFWQSNIHQLSSDLTKVKILLDERQEIRHPISVAYCQSSSRLYVEMLYSNNIKVFDLSLE